MPKQQGKSSLGSRFKANAPKEIDYGRQYIDLPGDIRNGVAELVEAKIGQYQSGQNEGKDFLYLAGVVISPKTAVEVKKIWKGGKAEVVSTEVLTIKGQRTSIMIPLCETSNKDGSKTTDEATNFQTASNELMKLAGAECLEGVDDDDALNNLLNELKNMDPPIRFKFSTRSKEPTAVYPESGVWPHSWHGTENLPEVEDEGDDIQDDNEPADEPAEEETPKKGPPTKAATPAKASPKKAEPEPEAEVPFGDDLDDLVADANGTDKKKKVVATNRLKELAMAAGNAEDDVDNAENWEAVAEMCRGDAAGGDEGASDEPAVDYVAIGKKADKNDKAAVKELVAAAKAAGLNDDDYESWTLLGEALAAEGGGEAEAEAEFEPQEDVVYLWKGPNDKKAKEYEVASINAKKKTVTLKDSDTMKIVNDPKTKTPLNVAWDELSE